MYAALWRVLPGPAWCKVIELVVLAAIVVVVCFTWVFPAVEPHLPGSGQTVG